jgi:hypothetical protein
MKSSSCVFVIAFLLALTAGPPADAAVPRDWLGVTVDGPLIEQPADHEGEWDLIGGSGATSVRTAFLWSQAQPQSPDSMDLRVSDALVLSAARRGLGVLPMVLAAPLWARTDPEVGGSPPRRPTDIVPYLQALVGRYGPRGSLWRDHPEVRPQPIRYWQIWNEPNLPGFWAQQPFARSYVRFLRVARRTLHRADAGARVVLGGLPNGWNALRQIYRAGGRSAFDVVAMHPYTRRPIDVVRIALFARRVMRRFGDRRKPLWITELSWPASKGKRRGALGIETDDRGQARRLRRGLLALAAARRRLGIERVYWYTWLSQEGGTSVFGWSGLRRLRADGEVVSTPALRAFRRVAHRVRRG